MNAEFLMLSLETATLAGSICISRGAKVLISCGGNPAVSHSNTLLRDVNDLMSQVGLTIRDMELFAVASGPGSFTGLRIGIATTKALATTLRRPCIGIPTLAAIAHSAGRSQATVSLLPAGRGEVFVQMFSTSEEGIGDELDQPQHLSPEKAIKKYMDQESVCWAGEGATLHLDLIRAAAAKEGRRLVELNESESASDQKGWRIASQRANLAEHVASLAAVRFTRDRDPSVDSLRAIYVRPSDAEMKT